MTVQPLPGVPAGAWRAYKVPRHVLFFRDDEIADRHRQDKSADLRQLAAQRLPAP